MKQALRKIFMSVALTATTFSASADETVISFLGSQPKNIVNCTSQDLMDLLDDEGKKYVDHIECEFIQTIPMTNKHGILMPLNNTTSGANLTIYFITAEQMKATRITFFGEKNDGTGEFSVFANDNIELRVGAKLASPTLPGSLSNVSSYPREKCILEMGKPLPGSFYKLNCFTPCVNGTSKAEFILSTLKVSVPKTSQIFLHGFKITHNGFVQNIDTAVEGIEGETNVATEYFDICGRKLTSAPASGLYIEKCGAKVTKKLANR